MDGLRICVIGAGVVGLGTTLCIQEMLRDQLGVNLSKVQLDVVADKFSPNVTSNVAAGIWEPYVDNGSQETMAQLTEWAKPTWEFFKKLWWSAESAESGLQIISGYVLTPSEELPEWRDVVLNFHPMSAKELSMFPPDIKYGYGFSTFICEQGMYLSYLMKRLKRNGQVHFIKKKLERIEELIDQYDLVINCSGLGANQLVNDERVTPIRGQVVRVRAPWAKMFVFDRTKHAGVGQKSTSTGCYILPNVNFCVLGGTYERGEWSTTPNPQTTRNIVDNCAKIMPGLEKAEVIEHICGLRPGRPKLRLEAEVIKGNKKDLFVVHNYGHGGSGVTMHIGTGLKASQLAMNCIKQLTTKAKL